MTYRYRWHVTLFFSLQSSTSWHFIFRIELHSKHLSPEERLEVSITFNVKQQNFFRQSACQWYRKHEIVGSLAWVAEWVVFIDQSVPFVSCRTVHEGVETKLAVVAEIHLNICSPVKAASRTESTHSFNWSPRPSRCSSKPQAYTTLGCKSSPIRANQLGSSIPEASDVSCEKCGHRFVGHKLICCWRSEAGCTILWSVVLSTVA